MVKAVTSDGPGSWGLGRMKFVFLTRHSSREYTLGIERGLGGEI